MFEQFNTKLFPDNKFLQFVSIYETVIFLYTAFTLD